MQHRPFRLAGRIFHLNDADADAVNRLRLVDLAAALALADKRSRSVVPVGGSVSTTFHVMDTQQMTKTLVVDGKELVLSDEAARAIESLQGRNMALASVVQGSAGNPTRDVAGSAMAAMRQDSISRRDPQTAYGASVARLGDAWKTPTNV